jgi:hypothetical protein
MRRLVKIDLENLSTLAEVRERQRATLDLDALVVGTPFGLYHEPIEKVEITRTVQKTPRWFDPRDHAGHLAVHTPDGRCAYLALTVNRERRTQVHPFDRIIAANAVRKAEQLDLLGAFANA